MTEPSALPDLDLDLGDIGLAGFDLDLDGFDIGGSQGKVETRYVKPPFYVGERRAPALYERAVDLVRDIGPAILAGERVDAVVSGNFIFGDFLEAFAVEANVLIDDLTLSTLSISKDNTDSLHNLLAGDYLGALNIVVSDYWYSHNRVNLAYIYEQLDLKDRFQLAVAGIHTKITLLRIGERKIVMHGSANLRSSRSVENVTIETNPAVYDFHHGWHARILERYATVRKSLRVGHLFDLIQEGS
ncbi:MAG TPA: hypothetical protein VFI96_01730 [Longimicrobiaceae bacterium]|nr:hypothetical protein [Longimicrobiaceae bacterium]